MLPLPLCLSGLQVPAMCFLAHLFSLVFVPVQESQKARFLACEGNTKIPSNSESRGLLRQAALRLLHTEQFSHHLTAQKCFPKQNRSFPSPRMSVHSMAAIPPQPGVLEWFWLFQSLMFVGIAFICGFVSWDLQREKSQE